MTATLKPWLVLASIFVAGALSGAALTMVLGPHPGPPPGPEGPREDMQKMWMLRLTRELKLTGDQQAKIEPILRDTAEQMRKNHTEEFDKASLLLKQSDDQIAALLTPDQKAELQKMIDERNKAFTQHRRQWGPPRDGGGPDGGGRPDHDHFHPGPGGDSPPNRDQSPSPPGQPPTPPPAPPATNAPGH